jgi:hypothetical protein
MTLLILAVTASLQWSPAPTATRYEFRSRDSDTEVWADRGSTINCGPDSCYAQVFQTERAVSSEWQVRACNDAGCSTWSNVVVLRAGQNLYTTDRPLLKLYGPEWQRGALAKWRLAPFDTGRVTILTQEQMQRAAAPRILQLYPTWYDPACGCYRDVP